MMPLYTSLHVLSTTAKLGTARTGRIELLERLTVATGLPKNPSMIDGSPFPEDSVDAAAVNNFNRGNWICY